jgi:hypothetical protein
MLVFASILRARRVCRQLLANVKQGPRRRFGGHCEAVLARRAAPCFRSDFS